MLKRIDRIPTKKRTPIYETHQYITTYYY